MNNNKKELLKALLEHWDYVSCKWHNEEEIMAAITELHLKRVFIILDEETQRAYLASFIEAFKTVTWDILCLELDWHNKWQAIK